MGNSSLSNAKVAKNDEFYTRYEDIEREMNEYIRYHHDVFGSDVFRDKVILLPCDDPDWSGFFQYFSKNFETLGLKKLIATCYAGGLGGKKATDLEKTLPLFNPGGPKGKLQIVERNEDGNGVKVEFQHLRGDGDFRSPEVRRLRDEADFVITNPPFSLFREFLAWIQQGEKQFIAIGPQNAITYKETFPLLKENKIWLGGGFKKGDAYFRVPEENAGAYAAGVYNPETSLVHFRNCTWYTNVDHWKRHQSISFHTMEENLKSNAKLRKKLLQDFGNADAYPHYDFYDAIEVPYVDAIPSDYDGAMGVPITFLDKYNPEQVEILNANDYRKSNSIPCKEHGLIKDKDGAIGNVTTYARILIRNRHPEPAQAPALPDDATSNASEEEEDNNFMRPGM